MAAVTLAQQIIAELPEDERLKCDTVEGETELFDLLDRYAWEAIADRAMDDIATEKARQHRNRAARHRLVVQGILQAIELGVPLRRALYTASLTHKAHAIVTDKSLLPTAYLRTAPDMDMIEAALRAGHEVPGATMSNPEPALLLKVR